MIDLRAIIAANETVLKSILGEGIELTTTLAETSLPVLADEGQLGQVLLNLVANARAASSSGGIVRIDVQRLTIHGSWLMRHG